MTLSIHTDPSPAITGKPFGLFVDSFDGTIVKWVLTSKPGGSALPLGQVGAATSTAARPTFTADVAGDYGITAEDHRVIAHVNPPVDTMLASRSVTIHAGDQLVRQIGVFPATATLTLVVEGDTILAASLAAAATASAPVKAAVADTGVMSNVAALVGVTVANLDDPLPVKISDLRSKYDSHRQQTAGVHIAADATNVVSLVRELNDSTGVFAAINELRSAFGQHIGSKVAHQNADTNHNPSGQASDVVSATACVDLLWALYEAHRVTIGSPPVHGVADASNRLVAQKPLAALNSAFILLASATTLAASLPGSPGVSELASFFGFEVTT